MRINMKKKETKFMWLCKSGGNVTKIDVTGNKLEQIEEFAYLESLVAKEWMQMSRINEIQNSHWQRSLQYKRRMLKDKKFTSIKEKNN